MAAAVTSKLGASLDRVAQEARGGLAGKMAHLGDTGAASEVAPDAHPVEDEETIRLTVTAPHGLHARPAARFVQTASSFDARVTIRDLTNGRGPADAASLNGVAMLGATQGHEIEVTAGGPQASEALAAIHALAERDFDDRPRSTVPSSVATPSLAAPDVAGIVRGHPASPGIAIGPARRFRTPDLPIPEVRGGRGRRARGVRRRARGRPERDRASARACRGDGDRRRGRDFDAHLLFLKDDALLAPTRDAIADGERSAAQAWHDVIERTAAQWDGLEDAYLRARAADLRSVGRQVLARLLGLALPEPELEAPGVVIARDLTPADTVGLDPSMALGIVTAAGDRRRTRPCSRARRGSRGRGRRGQRAYRSRGDAGRPGRVDGRGPRGSGGIGRGRAHRRARGARRGRP